MSSVELLFLKKFFCIFENFLLKFKKEKKIIN